MAFDEQYAQALRDLARVEREKAELIAALSPFVDCSFTYFSGKVLGSDAKLTREQVQRARNAIAIGGAPPPQDVVSTVPTDSGGE